MYVSHRNVIGRYAPPPNHDCNARPSLRPGGRTTRCKVDHSPIELDLLAGGELVIDSLRSIRDARHNAYVDHCEEKQYVDPVTAAVIVLLYDHAEGIEGFREHFTAQTVAGMAAIAWEVKRRSEAIHHKADEPGEFTLDCHWCDTHEKHPQQNTEKMQRTAEVFLRTHAGCSGGKPNRVKFSGDGKVLVDHTLGNK